MTFRRKKGCSFALTAALMSCILSLSLTFNDTNWALINHAAAQLGTDQSASNNNNTSTAGSNNVTIGQPLTSPTEAENTTQMRGEIGSIQIGTQNEFDWSTAGYFALQIDGPLVGRSDPVITSFNATIHMVRLDGNLLHKHEIYDFNQTSVTQQGDDTTTFNGTMTVTLRDGSHENVPGYIRVTNDLVSIWVDPREVDNHFGTTPIWGMVLPEREAQIPSG